ncbi:FxsA family protein [Propylenella binzhouense]|uniref:Membrane protein FxsA n=1 Tax=Propylenella binzhouense TaxID=2555902 RepID=A0A964WSB9_9HYPH|nr:FxsA family protein [Propylenella binzhouense]MYZ46819.1 membrane protein FxsA [Propylenella binzhouense]
MPFLLMLLAIPFAEIAMFILVGQEIGLAATLVLTLATAVAGTALLRQQGLSAITRIRAELDAGALPARALADGAMITAAGLFLLTPGFITDAVGLLLFIPPFRELVWKAIAKRLKVTVVQTRAPGRRAGPRVVDLDETEFTSRADPASPWRHRSGDLPGE